MGIKVNYTVPMATGGPIALAAGRGLFEQKQDVFNEGARQFDEGQALAEAKLAQQESQFGRDLQYQQELALLRNRQFEDQQAQRAYQFDAGLQATGYQREMDRRNRLQAMGYGEMFQRGREERVDVRDIAGEERREERLISSEGRQQQRREAERQWMTANKDAELILGKNLKPEALAQVAKQWEDRNHRPFPYQGAMQERMGESEGVSMARSILGKDFPEGMELAFEGMDPREASDRAFKLRDDAIAVRQADQDREQKAREDVAKMRIEEAKNKTALNIARINDILKQQQKKEVEEQKAVAAERKKYEDYYDTKFKEYRSKKHDVEDVQMSRQEAMRRATQDVADYREASQAYNSIPGQEALQGGISRAEARTMEDGWHGMIDGKMGTVMIKNGVKGIEWD